MLTALFHIARNTFRECIRQPIYIILLLTTTALVAAHPMLALYVFREQVKLVTDGSLASVMVFGWITAVLCASHSIAREIDTGTALLILAKPVSRSVFIVAKILGILTALTLFVWVTGCTVLMAVRSSLSDQFRFDPYILGFVYGGMAIACIIGTVRNYVRHESFPAGASIALAVITLINLVVVFFLPKWDSGYQWDEFPRYDPHLALAVVLVLFAVWAMGTLATALSTQFNLIGNLTTCAALFVVGLVSDYFYTQLQQLTLERLTQTLQVWPLLAVPFLLGAWFLATLHYQSRRNLRLKARELHVVFLGLLTALIGRGAYTIANRLYLADPSAGMAAIARGVFAVKTQVASLIHAVVPNWQLLWLADALGAHRPIPIAYVALGGAYILLFIVIFTMLAFAMFANREVGKQMAR